MQVRSISEADYKPHVLVVDDNEINLKVARMMLEKIGLSVDTAGSGEEGVAKTTKCHYDLILMDVTLSGMAGPEATQLIRCQDAYARTPIIAWSGHDACEDFHNAGMSDCLAKPIQFAALTSMLARWLPSFTAPGF